MPQFRDKNVSTETWRYSSLTEYLANRLKVLCSLHNSYHCKIKYSIELTTTQMPISIYIYEKPKGLLFFDGSSTKKVHDCVLASLLRSSPRTMPTSTKVDTLSHPIQSKPVFIHTYQTLNKVCQTAFQESPFLSLHSLSNG